MKCSNSNCNNKTKASHHKYCSRSCHMVMRNQKSKTGHVKLCECCGMEMYVAKWEQKTKKYCSYVCKNKSSLVERLPITCSLHGCSSVVFKTQKQVQKTKNHYCSARCSSIAGRLAAQETGKKTGTKPEIHFIEWCKSNEVEYVHQYNVPWKKGWKKWYDFYLPKYNLLVEVDGVYWHGKGLLDSELNDQQSNTRRNDLEKNKLAAMRGYNLLRIWEDEINNFNKQKIISYE